MLKEFLTIVVICSYRPEYVCEEISKKDETEYKDNDFVESDVIQTNYSEKLDTDIKLLDFKKY